MGWRVGQEYLGELGNLGLSPDEEADIVAFIKTLTDGYTPPPAP